MAKTLADMWTEVEVAFERAEWDRALRRCVVMLQGAPACYEARMKVADILLKLGRSEQAAGVYKLIAWHFTKAGYPLLALVALKMLAPFEAYNDALEVMAGLYSVDSDRVAADAPHPELPQLDNVELTSAGENIDRVLPLQGAELAALATRLAEDEKGLDRYPTKLPAIPLFSELPEDAFAVVLQALKPRRFAGDGLILREGEPGHSFFLLARGRVRVTKRVGTEDLVLANLSDGAVFGEMALVSREPRTASVRALGHVDLLELEREALEREAVQLASVQRALTKFTRTRLLNNLMALSVLFRTLPAAERHALLDRFISMEVKKGQVIIEEGRRGIGLFVVLRGEAEVKKREGDSLVPLALLREGDVFGEISLVKDVATTATVLAGRDGEFLFLSRREFEDQVRRNPDLWRTLSEVGEDRLRETARLMSVTDCLSDDEVVLV